MLKTMKNLLTAFLLFIPVLAFAECGMAMTGATLTIVVGKSSSGKCFSSDFADTFKSTVTDALEESEVVVPARRRAFDERNARGAKLWSIAERQHQLSSGRYFGQK